MSVGNSVPVGSSGGGSFDFLGKITDGFLRYKEAQFERDLAELDYRTRLQQNTVTSTQPNVDANLADPLGDTVRATLSDPQSLLLLGVAGVLVVALILNR